MSESDSLRDFTMQIDFFDELNPNLVTPCQGGNNKNNTTALGTLNQATSSLVNMRSLVSNIPEFSHHSNNIKAFK